MTSSMYKSLLWVIALMFFPITVRFLGFDAFTTATAAIYLLFAWFFVRTPALFQRTHFPRVILGLLLLSVLSTISIEGEFFSASFRRFFASCAGFLLFYMVANSNARLASDEQGHRIEQLLSFILYLYAVQLLIGFAIYFVPEVGRYFAIFTTRDVDLLESSVTDTVKRMTSIIIPREAVGEIVAVLTPIVLYKLLAKGNARYYVILAIYFLGVTLSATRSGFLLFFFAVFLYTLAVLPMIKLPTWSIFIVVAGVSAPVAFIMFPDLFKPIMHRMSEFFQVYEESESLAVAINRAGVWYYVVEILMPNISLWGNGFLTIHEGVSINFHNLYATVFHRHGVIGFVLFFYIFYKIVKSLMKARRHAVAQADKALIYACLTSIVVLLINEIKYEFTRQPSYQQTIWVLLGVYFLVALYISNRRKSAEGGGRTDPRPRSRTGGLLAKYGYRDDVRSQGTEQAKGAQ